MATSSNETYIGTNSGQMKDETFSGDNIITKTIKIDNSKNIDVATKFKNANVVTNENSIFWINSPSILFSKNHITELWPIDKMTREQKLNAITRLVILLTLAGFLLSKNYKILVTGFVSIVFLIITYKIL